MSSDFMIFAYLAHLSTVPAAMVRACEGSNARSPLQAVRYAHPLTLFFLYNL